MFAAWSHLLLREVGESGGGMGEIGFVGFCPRKRGNSLLHAFSALRRIGVTVVGNDIVRSEILLYSDRRGLRISLKVVDNIVPHRRNTIKVSSNSAHSVTLVSGIGGPIYFVILNFRHSRANGVATVLSHGTIRLNYGGDFISGLHRNSIVGTHIARLRGFNTFVSVNTNVGTLVPVSVLSISHVGRPHRQLCRNRDVHAILEGERPRGLAFSLGRLLNA